jgi:hypothetical protein
VSTLNVDKVDPSTGTTLTLGTSGDTISIPSGVTIANSGTATGFGSTAWQSVVTGSTLTAVAFKGYPIDTTSNACTVTLPAGSVGDTVELVDYAGTWDTNNCTIAADGSEKINGGDTDAVASVEREGLKLVYVDATQGWVVVTAANDGSSAVAFPYTLSWLVIAGGGGGGDNHAAGGGAGGYRNSYASETSGGGGSTETPYSVSTGIVITVTVGGGGAGSTDGSTKGTSGVDSSISGSGLTTITSDGGGGAGSTEGSAHVGLDGGSGGGGTRGNAAGSGTANQGYDGSPSFNSGNYPAGGGGGAGAAAVCASNTAEPDGGVGVSSSINGSATFRGGGGGGGAAAGGASAAGEGGNGGGGDGKSTVTVGDNGDANTGGGAGGGGPTGSNGGTGGSGVVILRMPTANYSSTTTGSPGETTDGSDTILTFNASGSYTT